MAPPPPCVLPFLEWRFTIARKLERSNWGDVEVQRLVLVMLAVPYGLPLRGRAGEPAPLQLAGSVS